MPQELFKKTIEHLKKTWGEERQCPMCGESKFGVSDMIFELREFHDEDSAVIIGGGIAPVIPVVCQNCGNTILISAIVTGDVELAKEEAK